MKKLRNIVVLMVCTMLLSSCNVYSFKEEIHNNKDEKYNEYMLSNDVETDDSLNLIDIANQLLKDPNDFAITYSKRYIEKAKQRLLTTHIRVKYQSNYDGDTYNFITTNDFTWSDNNQKISWKKGDQIVVRTLLIDTSEMKSKKTKKPEAYAEAAKNYAEKQLRNAEEIELIFDVGSHYDHYGRTLAYVLVDNQLLGEMLLRQGLAKIGYVTKENVMYLSIYKAAQKAAQKQKLNLWSE